MSFFRGFRKPPFSTRVTFRVPRPLDGVGFFNEHKLELPAPDCGNDVCLHGELGVMGNMTNGSNCTLVMLGLNTPVDPSAVERPALNLAIAVYAGFDMAASRAAYGDYNGALSVVPLGEQVELWLETSPNEDIADDVVYIDKFIARPSSASGSTGAGSDATSGDASDWPEQPAGASPTHEPRSERTSSPKVRVRACSPSAPRRAHSTLQVG